MHPEVSQSLAAERIRDLRDEATAARRARFARRTGRGGRAPRIVTGQVLTGISAAR